MYKTPKIKSELYDIPNTIGENNKAKADPSLPRKPDFPEVDVSDLTETTIDKLSSREAARADILNKFNSGRRNASVTYPLPVVHDNAVIVYGNEDITDTFDCYESEHVSVTRNVHGGFRTTSKVTWDPFHSEYWRDQLTAVHTYYLYAGNAEESHQIGDSYWITDYFVTDASLLSQVNPTLGDQSQEYQIPFDMKSGEVLHETGELILPFTQTYTDYTKLMFAPNKTLLEVVVGGRQRKTIPNILGTNVVAFSSTEDAPDTDMPNPDDEGNYSVDIDVKTQETYDIVITNFSVYPRLIRIEI